MKRVLSILCVTILSALLVFTAGCAESQQSGQTGDKRARLVSVENSKLKQQLQEQKDLLAACQQKNVEIYAQTREIETNLLVIFGDMAQNFQLLIAENDRLKAEIAKLKAAKKD